MKYRFDTRHGPGWVYVAQNSFMPGLVKIGYTTGKDPNVRMNDLSHATGVPGLFTITHIVQCTDALACEQITHRHLDEHRVAAVNGRVPEFFKLDANTALEAIYKFGHEFIGIADIEPKSSIEVMTQEQYEHAWKKHKAEQRNPPRSTQLPLIEEQEPRLIADLWQLGWGYLISFIAFGFVLSTLDEPFGFFSFTVLLIGSGWWWFIKTYFLPAKEAI